MSEKNERERTGAADLGLGSGRKFTGSAVRKSTRTPRARARFRENRLPIYRRRLSNGHRSSAAVISYSLKTLPTTVGHRHLSGSAYAPSDSPFPRCIRSTHYYRRTTRADLQNFIIVRPNNTRSPAPPLKRSLSETEVRVCVCVCVNDLSKRYNSVRE